MPMTQNGDVSLYYEARGQGETLLLSAGLGGTAGYWSAQAEALSGRFRVVTYDHAGSGRSTRDVGARSVREFAADMLAVIRASGAERAHVMGHAVGGIMGLQLAIDTPEAVQSLAIVNGWGAPDPHVARCFAVRLNLLHGCGVAAYVEAQPLFLYPASWTSERDGDLRRAAETMPDHMPCKEDLAARIAVFAAHDPGDAALAGVRVPVLCLATKDDMLVPWTASRDLAARLGNGEFVLLPWGGHASSHTAPDTFDAALETYFNRITGALVP